MGNVLLVSTLGSGSREEARLRELFRNFAGASFVQKRASAHGVGFKTEWSCHHGTLELRFGVFPAQGFGF